MSVATLRHQVSCPSDFMRATAVIPLEVSTSELGPLFGLSSTPAKVVQPLAKLSTPCTATCLPFVSLGKEVCRLVAVKSFSEKLWDSKMTSVCYFMSKASLPMMWTW